MAAKQANKPLGPAKPKKKADNSNDVNLLRKGVAKALDMIGEDGRKAGDAKFGVYAFYDYDDEPIYVGQTCEKLRSRIGRHLTNQRTDAVAMNVLDPFEVAAIEMFPLWHMQEANPKVPEVKAELNAYEFAVYHHALQASYFGALLNEKDIQPASFAVELPQGYKVGIIPDELFAVRNHPDVRIARRASTIAALAKVVSEREVSAGLRRTLRTQARRLWALADARFGEFAGEVPVEIGGEETGDDDD